MKEETVLDRFKLPIGSVLVDGALVLALVFSTGQMMERFEQMDARLQRIENLSAETRFASLELRAQQAERQQAEIKVDIVKRLDRIEGLLDNRSDRQR